MNAAISENSPVQLDYLQQLIKLRRFDEAETHCLRHLNQTAQQGPWKTLPKEAQANVLNIRHLLGTIYYLKGALAKSIECFKKVLELDPKHTDAAISLSVIYNDIGRYDEAKKIYQIANHSLNQKHAGDDRFVDRKFALKHIELGDMYFKFHRYDEALEDYQRAYKLDPTLKDVRIKFAKAYAKKGFNSRAIQELQSLCADYPDFTTARIQLGLMHFSQGNVIDAQTEWEKVLAHDPQNSEVGGYLQLATQATDTSH